MFFAEGDVDNKSCPARGKSALDAELLAIALALKIIVQKRPPKNYEIHTDSMAACNLVNGYQKSRNYFTDNIVEEAKYYLERATGKVRMNYVKGHSGVVENENAEFLAKVGRRRAQRGCSREEYWGCVEGEERTLDNTDKTEKTQTKTEKPQQKSSKADKTVNPLTKSQQSA